MNANTPKPKSLVKRWAEETSMHGFPDLFSSRHMMTIIFWSAVIIIAISLALFQSKTELEDFANKATQFVDSPVSPNETERSELLRIAACPNNWIRSYGYGELKYNESDMEKLMFAVSLLPNADMGGFNYLLVHNYLHTCWNGDKNCPTNVTKQFGKFSRGAKHYDQLRKDLKTKMGNMSLVEYLRPYASLSGANFKKDKIANWLISHGRLCHVLQPFGLMDTATSNNASTILTSGEVPPVRYLMLSDAYVDQSETYEFFRFVQDAFTPYLAVDSTKAGTNFRIPTISELKPTAFASDIFKESATNRKSDSFLLYSFKINIKRVERLNLHRSPCTPVDIRAPNGYLKAKCVEDCRKSVSNILKLPCQLGFTNSWDSCSYGYAVFSDANNLYVDNETSEYQHLSTRRDVQTALAACSEKYCVNLKACTYWEYSFESISETEVSAESIGLTLSNSTQRKLLVELVLDSVTLSTETLKVTTANLLSTIGGLFGFYIGASVVSFVQVIVFCGTTCYNKSRN